MNAWRDRAPPFEDYPMQKGSMTKIKVDNFCVGEAGEHAALAYRDRAKQQRKAGSSW
jgi:hypothetical protein